MQRNRAAFSVFFWSSVPNRLSDKNKHGETPMRLTKRFSLLAAAAAITALSLIHI